MLLEHHHALAAGPGDLFAVRQHTAGIRFVEAGDEVEQRALAATARADEADELALAHFEAHVLQRLHAAGARGEGFGNALHDELGGDGGL